jgi:hypothetical protein
MKFDSPWDDSIKSMTISPIYVLFECRSCLLWIVLLETMCPIPVCIVAPRNVMFYFFWFPFRLVF